VRREEVSTRPELTHTRWLWLKNWTNLSAPQRRDLHRLMRPSPTLNTITTTRRKLKIRSCPSHQTLSGCNRTQQDQTGGPAVTASAGVCGDGVIESGGGDDAEDGAGAACG
jgi:hypothetical protein